MGMPPALPGDTYFFRYPPDFLILVGGVEVDRRARADSYSCRGSPGETDHAVAFAPKASHEVIALREFGRVRPLEFPIVQRGVDATGRRRNAL
jgi:hypothetical protein